MALGDTTTQKLDGQIHMIRKANKSDTQQVITQSLLTSEDEFQSLYFTPKKNTNVVVEPPFNPLQLASLVHKNNVLAQCITAMEVNIDGSGYTFELLDAEQDKVTGDSPVGLDDGSKSNVGTVKDPNASGLPSRDNDTNMGVVKVSKLFGSQQTPQAPQAPQGAQPPAMQQPPKQGGQGGQGDLQNGSAALTVNDPNAAGDAVTEIDPELEMLEHFFNEPFPGMSFTTMRRKLRVDMEATGNGYMEVIRNMAGDVVFLRHLEAVMMRLVKLDAPTNVEVTVTRGGKEVQATLPMRERRFAYKVGANLVYYREFGASRQVNRSSGSWIEPKSPDNKNIDLLGSEVIHFALFKDFRTHYGMPRWINQLPSILGSRKSEEFNLEFFDAGGLPPAIIFVQGGALVGGVKEQLQQYLSGTAKSKHRAAIVEVMSTSGSLDSAGSVTVKTERFGGCQDDQSEVLTDKGWIYIKDWNGELVASIQDSALVYHQPLQYHVYDHDGDLVHIEGHATEFMVTLNHRVLWEDRKFVHRIDPASTIFKKNGVKLPVSPVLGYCGSYQLNFNIAGVDYTSDTFLDFLGMFIADGSTSARGGNGDIVINVKKQRKKDFILSFFPQVAIQSKRTLRVADSATRLGYTSYNLWHKPLRNWLRENVGTYANNKRIPSEFLKLNQVQSERLLMALMNGDGHRNDEANKNGWTYTTISDQLADDVQTLCIHAGYRSVKTLVKNRHEWCISITPKNFAVVSKGKCPKWEKVHYEGKVYCFTMPTGVFVSRRNGKVCITGNSASDAQFQTYDANCGEHVRKSFRLPKVLIGDTDVANRSVTEASIQAAENQVFQPERFLFDEVINTTIVKALGAKRYRLRSKNMTIADPDMQLNALKASWNLIKGETFVETANEISGLSLKYSKEAEAANKPPAPPAGGDPNDPNAGGDPNDPYGDGSVDMGAPPGQYDDDGSQGSMQPPQNQNMGTPQQYIGMQGNGSAGAELGQAPPVGQGGSYSMKAEVVNKVITKSERYSPTELVKLVDDWTIAMGLSTGTLDRDVAEITHRVDTLKAEDRTFFDQIVVKKMFKDADPDAVSLINSCGHNHD